MEAWTLLPSDALVGDRCIECGVPFEAGDQVVFRPYATKLGRARSLVTG